jgi:selenium-binding protein 1
MAKVDLGDHGMQLDASFFLDTGSLRPHQVRLQGGDASSDSYCYA